MSEIDRAEAALRRGLLFGLLASLAMSAAIVMTVVATGVTP